MYSEHDTERILDYDKLKTIFVNNDEVLEQVMHGLIVTAHQKGNDLEKFYKDKQWDKLYDTVTFLSSSYQHISTAILIENIKLLNELVENQEYNKSLADQIKIVQSLSKVLIKNIEEYLHKN